MNYRHHSNKINQLIIKFSIEFRILIDYYFHKALI